MGPLRRRDTAILAAFDAFFAQPDVTLVPLTAAVFDDVGFQTPDAVHLAAAIENGCGLFLTNDN